MSGLRLATTQRELRRTSPTLLLEMRDNLARVTRIADFAVQGGAPLPSVTYDAGSVRYIVMFDAQSGLPVRIRTLDFDNFGVT